MRISAPPHAREFDMRSPLRILQVYNKYRRYGGEDKVVELEASLLKSRGHEVELLSVSTEELIDAHLLRFVAAGLGSVWSWRGYSLMSSMLRSFKPNIVHVHNTFPLLSPSIYWAANRQRVPVVQTLHNFRLTCANAHLLREDKPCQKCVGHSPWAALRHRCLNGSLAQTSAVVASNVVHRLLRTYDRKIAAYVALNEFSREVMVSSGLPADKIFVKSNFGPERSLKNTPRLPQLTFVGAVSRAKGVHLLLDAWRRLSPKESRLVLIGDGSDRSALEREYAQVTNVVWRGSLPHEEVLESIASSRFVVLPSLCYENFPMVLLEAFSMGTPVIVPNHGAFPSIVSDRVQGLLFSPGYTGSLIATLREALDLEESTWIRLSQSAHYRYATDYTEDSNYAHLMEIYERVIALAQKAGLRGVLQRPSMQQDNAPEISGD
jgi:glycosyltransferase involved in cell wall biosynthesis